jgi:hypothetical protein
MGLAIHILAVHGMISLTLFTSIQSSTSISSLTPGQTLVTQNGKALHIMVCTNARELVQKLP